jgi:phospholipid-binding lipoprotein MlaA
MEKSKFKTLALILILSALGLSFSSLCEAGDLVSPADDGRTEISEVPPEPSLSEEPEGTLPDPLEPVNRAFFHFNDKLYFWVFKPVASGYRAIVPIDLRIGLRNFFSNLTTPVRLANSLLQVRFKSAGNETVRFVLNTTLGLGGFLDPAKKELKIEKSQADFGQTLGVWGMGASFYIHWPVLGPSNLRDSFGFAGDLLLDPRTYLLSAPIFYVVRPVELVNETSLTAGEYEGLKRASLDPYIAVKDAYSQYRQGRIRGK